MNENIIVFALTTNKKLVEEVCGYLKIEPGKIEVRHFADGENLIEAGESVRGKHVFIIQSTCKPVNEKLMELLVCVDSIKRASAKEITVITPYFGYARQDRKARARQPITARLVADLLTAAGIDRIVTVDLHAQQIQGFFNVPTDDLSAIPIFAHYFKKKVKDQDIVVVSPDHGGTTRARYLAEYLQAPIAIIDKRRPRPNVVEVNNVIGDVSGKVCVVVDDICDTAGSLVAGCELLKQKGAADIFACVTHGVFSHDALEKVAGSSIKEMVISNTIPLDDDAKKRCKKIKVLSVGFMLYRVIDGIANNKPLSKVFDCFSVTPTEIL
ncbi:MAG: ribose-phosphate pyrophosphokinase [Erysipelotrichaceae bacterium]|nr:ribose-phosphate pyrophosphokinase [Erysipelotrichaceae bacterium]